VTYNDVTYGRAQSPTVVENLGYSGAAYEMTKSRLEQKYGGKRQSLMLKYEELDKFKQIRDGHDSDVEK
jgi:hypothetical protein